ncbi:MAG TPA: CBS domain-containing protein [Candidatus Caldiarchaeum subterraneum]|uniref:CBS domain-containing protein n=1 Tax=Caldiarchaeum subterraneum TaxID=311458 RepID=A0A832ZUB1_CALS0|nr:CBS domain-containing protein [Aigarchaeota archaeon]HIQ29095.1 CBS domain-containing protein [Candidatus Caldarchaeum subterraneum]
MVKPALLAEEVRVRDVMSSPVIEADAEETLDKVADRMEKYHIGSVVITKNGQPVGIITKRDIVDKVVARDLRPSSVRAGDIMSSPLHIADPDLLIDEALRKMNKMKVSRLVVVYKGKITGMISLKDILQVTPEILDIVREQLRIKGVHVNRGGEGLQEGYCDACGEWSDMLVRIDDQLLCEECRLEMEKR